MGVCICLALITSIHFGVDLPFLSAFSCVKRGVCAVQAVARVTPVKQVKLLKERRAR
jgi:hypothetical protein